MSPVPQVPGAQGGGRVGLQLQVREEFILVLLFLIIVLSSIQTFALPCMPNPTMMFGFCTKF